jgi:hypothetical protein
MNVSPRSFDRLRIGIERIESRSFEGGTAQEGCNDDE